MNDNTNLKSISRIAVSPNGKVVYAVTQTSKIVGEELGRRLLEKNISSVSFDRGIRPYHGCIQALAEGVKEVGLNF